MKSIAEFYEKNQLDLVIGKVFFFLENKFGFFIGTRGHELDVDDFCFVFESEEVGELTVDAYEKKYLQPFVLPDGKVSHLNRLLHQIRLRECCTNV